MMAKKLRSAISLILVFVMCFGMLNLNVLAATASTSDIQTQAQEQIVYRGGTNYYTAEGAEVTDGGDYDVSITKTVEATGTENLFDVTVKVEYKTNTTSVSTDEVSTALIIDLSASMKYCAECGESLGQGHGGSGAWHQYCPDNSGNEFYDRNGDRNYNCDNCGYYESSHTWTQEGGCDSDTSRLEAAKAAAIDFLESYAGENLDDDDDANDVYYAGRYISLVTFGSVSETHTFGGNTWIDVGNAASLKTVTDYIGDLDAKSGAWGGTNTDDGLTDAAGYMDTAPTGTSNLNAILLTDGIPTFYNNEGDYYYHKNSDTKIDDVTGTNGNGGSAPATNAASAAAKDLTDTGANLYAIAFGTEDAVVKTSNNKTKDMIEWLKEDCNCGEKDVFDARNSNSLEIAFTTISESVTTGATGSSVTDVVDGGDGRIVFVDWISQNGAAIDDDKSDITWDLANAQADGEGTNSYTMKYQVRLKTEASGFQEGTPYTLGEAKVTYSNVATDAADNEKGPHTKGSPQPEVKGYLGTINFTKVDVATNELLKGATFALVHDASNCTGTCAELEQGKKVTITFDPFTTEDNGVVHFDHIPSGHDYTLTEVKAPDGYQNTNLPSWAVTVEYGEVTVTGAPVDGKIPNAKDPNHEQNRVQITVMKDWINELPVTETAVIGVYYADDIGDDGKPLAGSEPVATTYPLKEGEKYTFNLPAVDENGWAIEYKVAEVDTTNWIKTAQNEDGVWVVTNLLQGAKDLIITKTWVAPEKAKGAVTVQVYRDTVAYGSPIVLNAYNNWTATVPNVEIINPDTGEEYDYTVVELDENGEQVGIMFENGSGNLFTVSVNGLNITNTIIQQTTELTGEKIWKAEYLKEILDDEQEKAFTTTIQLYADGQPTGKTVTVSLNDSSWSFTGLPMYALEDNGYVDDTDGHKITYTAKEVGAEDGQIEITYNEIEYTFRVDVDPSDPTKITNTLIADSESDGNVTVTKIWEDDGDEQGLRPDSVTLRLTAQDSGDYYDFTFTADKEEQMEVTVTVPVSSETEPEGEGENEGESVTTDPYATDPDTDVTPVEPETTTETKTVTVRKWSKDVVSATQQLPVYNANGARIVYTVSELGVDNEGKLPADPTIDGTVTGAYYAVNIDNETLTVTNTLGGTPTISITVKKDWNNGGYADGKTATISLLSNGGEVIKVELDGEIDDTETSPWQFTVTGLPRYQDGVEIDYTVVEEPVEGYEEPVIDYSKLEDGIITVTNTIDTDLHVDDIDVTVNKTLDWNGYAPGTLPEVTFVLYAKYNGEEKLVGSIKLADMVVVAENSQYTHTWEDLDRFATVDGKVFEIDYVVVESENPGHFTKTEGAATENSWNFTNTFNPGTVTVGGTKTWNSEVDYDVTVGLYKVVPAGTEGAMVLTDGTGNTVNVVLVDTTTTVNGSYSFTADVYDTDGNVIAYRIFEHNENGPVSHGGWYDGEHVVTYAGTAITNTRQGTQTIEVSKVWAGPVAEGTEVNFIVSRRLVDTEDAWTDLATITVSADTEWEGSLNVPTHNENGVQWVYSVRESGAEMRDMDHDGTDETLMVTVNGTDYEVAANGNVFTNTVWDYQNAEVTVEKHWGSIVTDEAAEMTPVTIQLVKLSVENGETVAFPVSINGEDAKIVLSGDNNWTHTWSGLPVYDSVSKQPITYAVREVGANGGSIENGSKIVVTGAEGDTQRYLVTYGVDEATGAHIVTNTRTAIDDYYFRVIRTYTIEGEDTPDPDPVIGSWQETDKGTVLTINANGMNNENWLTLGGVTYTFQDGETFITNGENEDLGESTYTGTTNVTFTVEDYETENSNVRAKYYTVHLFYHYAPVTEPEPGPGPQQPTTTTLTIKKNWSGDEGLDTRPESINVILTNEDGDSETITLSATNGWTYSRNGVAIGSEWYVEEISVADYSVTYTGQGTTAITITNTYSGTPTEPDPTDPQPETTTLTVSKSWVGDEGLGVRPNEITVILRSNEGDVETVTLSAANNWRATVEVAAGKTWTAQEANVPVGYAASVTGGGNTFAIVNTWVDTPIDDEPVPTDGPENDPGDDPDDDIDLQDDDVPLTDLPDELIEDEEPPLANLPHEEEEEIIDDEDVPLANVPQTGDPMTAWLAFFSSVSGMGLAAALGLKKKKED